MRSLKKIILCADDFGISQGVSNGIIQLLEKNRLSAVSCMSLGQAWGKTAHDLKPFEQQTAVGLHITLTYLPPLNKSIGVSHPCEKTLFLQTWTRTLDQRKIKQEIKEQFEHFIDVWGQAPDFIDGHQHVHVLPLIRDFILDLRSRYAPQAWMRNVVHLTSLEHQKQLILAVLGWYFCQRLKKENIPHNHQIFGFYNLYQPTDFSSYLERWIEKADPEKPALIYCHPGFPDASLKGIDDVFDARQREFDFLSSDTFGLWLQERIKLVKHC